MRATKAVAFPLPKMLKCFFRMRLNTDKYTHTFVIRLTGLSWQLSGKEFACSVGDTRQVDLMPGSGRSWEKEMATHSSISCLGKSHGQRSLAGYSPWSQKESDLTECMHTHHMNLFPVSLFFPTFFSALALSSKQANNRRIKKNKSRIREMMCVCFSIYITVSFLIFAPV